MPRRKDEAVIGAFSVYREIRFVEGIMEATAVWPPTAHIARAAAN